MAGLGAGAGTGADIRIGISGWRYPPWRGDFYPKGLAQRLELDYASSRLRTIEVNGSFYSLQPPSNWRAWRDTVPEDFEFAVKGGRFITHMKRLKDPATALSTFFSSGPALLGARLGPILWQLPPNLQYDAFLVDDFLRALPRTLREAAALARLDDRRIGRSGDEPLWQRAAAGEGGRRLRCALEVRHESFRDPSFVDLCRAHGVAIVVADAGEAWPQIDEVTSDHMYPRLHGGQQTYVSGYPPAELERWAERIRGWPASPGVESVRVYFDNDVKVRAPYDAMALASLLGVGRPD